MQGRLQICSQLSCRDRSQTVGGKGLRWVERIDSAKFSHSSSNALDECVFGRKTTAAEVRSGVDGRDRVMLLQDAATGGGMTRKARYGGDGVLVGTRLRLVVNVVVDHRGR